MTLSPNRSRLSCIIAVLVTLQTCLSWGQNPELNVLLVVAHQDDYAMFAGSVYKITHTLGGNVDLALISDGSGGFGYSQLAEPIYGLDLTNEAVAREHLSDIRNQEMRAGGEIIGVRNYFYLEQHDRAYTENIDTVLSLEWDADQARSRLVEIMELGQYDYVFAHLPIEHFHAQHKSSTILAIEAAQQVRQADRPVVLGSFFGASRDDQSHRDFVGHPGYPVTQVRTDVEPFVFDRTETLDPRGRLNYHIVINWLIAEHKSQGTMQLFMNSGDVERFWWFDVNDAKHLPATKELFDRLAIPTVARADGSE